MSVQVRVAVAQRNIKQAEQWLLQISHPLSPLFGRHWEYQQVLDWFSPDPEATQAVVSWLQQSGVTSSQIAQTQDGSLVFNATIREMEDIFKTSYGLYGQDHNPQLYLGCEEYSIPTHLRDYIDFITPSTPITSSPKIRLNTRYAAGDRLSDSEEEERHHLRRGTETDLPSHCGDMITPACLRSLYRFPENDAISPHPESTLGVVEITLAHWLPSDLDMFFQQYAGTLVGLRPVMHGINGGRWQDIYKGQTWNVEADLDMEYTMALTSRPVFNYQIGPVDSAGPAIAPRLNGLLAALDGSYCGALNNPLDCINTTLFRGASCLNPECGTSPRLPAVVSISYLWDEAGFPAGYLERQCLEFLKLGLLGVTVVASSGDSGAAGHGEECQQRREGRLFRPSSPSSCPYVTAVGGTQLPPHAITGTREVAFFKNKTGVISSSGGGFSNVFSAPAWQQAAVRGYLEQRNQTLNGSVLFNHAGRGIPDIAANSRNYVTAIDGKWMTVDGTSASAPVVASLVVLLNDMRLRAGKGTVGFLNPVLYAHPEAMNDIIEGANFDCAQPAFNTAPGWDPVTGLGTPDFKKLKDIYQALP